MTPPGSSAGISKLQDLNLDMEDVEEEVRDNQVWELKPDSEIEAFEEKDLR